MRVAAGMAELFPALACMQHRMGQVLAWPLTVLED
jgi:hypothetical protein